MIEDIPTHDIIEVSVFSRGYGEAIALHVGSGAWLLIDSLKTSEGIPAAVEYLDRIGVDSATAVEAVLLTHWHDDHVAGATEVVKRCGRADVIISGALRKDEFQAFLRANQVDSAGSFGSGVQELMNILRHLKATSRQPRWAWADKILAARRDENRYSFEALSPSEKDFEHLLLNLAGSRQNGGRMVAPKRNDASVAAVIEVANDRVLLGADLEVAGPGAGWEAIHSSVWKDRGQASLFKVAHHGSVTGEYAPVWTDMLVKNVMAVLTPWSRGSKLPSQGDVDRILGHTANAYAASKVRLGKSLRRSNTVERSLREADIKVVQEQGATGHIRFRKRAGEPWSVDFLGGDSCHLSKILAA